MSVCVRGREGCNVVMVLYLQEAHQAKEKTYVALEEVKQTTQIVNGLLAASKLQADCSFNTLGKLQTLYILFMVSMWQQI